MTEIHHTASPAERPLSIHSFQGKLDKFERYIADVTLQNSEASVEEKRQSINDNLRYEAFCEHIRSLFGTDIKSQDLKAIHRKLSTNPEVKIDWSEVFGYFQTEREQSENQNEEISVFTVSKRKTIGEAAGDKKRRDTIQAVIYSPEFDYYITASQKGAISIYNGKLRLQNCIDINESAWMTSCQYLPKLRKVIATTERSIVIWDHRAKGKNQSNIHVIKPLEHSPQCMCLVPSEDDHFDSLLIGDDSGFINLIRLTHNDFVVKTNKDQKRVMRYNVIDPASLTVPIVRRRFHQDWVLQVRYLSDLKCFASCSPGDKLSLVISSLKRIHDTQSVSELNIPRGVNAFCYSEKSNLFATGGVDKTIRLWHPNILSRPTGKMVGHLFTIIDIVMNEKDQHVISLSTARVFRVWDIHTLACLQVFTDSDERSGDRRISAMLFDSRRDRLFTGSSTIDLWPMTRSVQDTMSVPHTHDHPLTTVVLNVSASQIITVCTESIIKVWEVETGRQMYQIMDAHGSNVEVTAVAVDDSGKRMYSGGYDGSVKVWEFSSGQEIKSFLPEDSSKEEDHSVVAIACLASADEKESEEEPNEEIEEEPEEVEEPPSFLQQVSVIERKPRKIIVIGWNNKVKIFQDDENSPELVFMSEVDGTYEWTIPAPSSPVQSLIESELGGTDEESERIPLKEDVLIHNEVTSFSDVCVADLNHLLVTGCSNGNVIVWDTKTSVVQNVFDLAKAELASSYDSHHHRSKEKHPHRVNDVVTLCHKIYRPDPEELKRRLKLKKKKAMEEEGIKDEEEVEKEKNNDEADENAKDDDPAEEVDLDVEDDGSKNDDEGDEERHSFDFGLDSEPIKMVEVLFPPVIATCHQDTDVRFWSLDGELICSIVPTMRSLSPLTAICCDQHADHVMAADAKGYITVWNVSEFLEKSTGTIALPSRVELIKQLVCWRAHIMKIVSLVFVDCSRVLVSASTDGSVRVWYPQRGHYIGYFGQHRIWHVDPNPSLPSSPVLPYDITEAPLNPVNVRSGKRKPQTKKYEYPLVFDADRWKPFRRSAYLREAPSVVAQPQANLNVIEIRNKKFFSALVKPKADKSGLESDKPIDSDTGAIFHHLPVYRLKTPPMQPQRIDLGYATGFNDEVDSGKQGSVGANKPSMRSTAPGQAVKIAKTTRFPARKPVSMSTVSTSQSKKR